MLNKLRNILVIILVISIIGATSVPVNASSLSDQMLESFEMNEEFLFDLISENTIYDFACEQIAYNFNGSKYSLSILQPRNKITYTEGSNSGTADYIVVDSNNKVIGLIKADGVSISSIRKVIEKANETSYTGISNFDDSAKKLGINAELVGQTLSSEQMTEFAEKAIGKTISFVIRKISGSNAYSAVVAGAVECVSSTIQGNDAATTFSTTTTTVANTVASDAAKYAVIEIVTVAVLAIGFPEAAATVLAVAIGIVAGVVVGEILEELEDELDVNEALAYAYDDFMTGAAEICIAADDAISEHTNIKKSVKKVKKGLVYICESNYDFYTGLVK